MSDRLQGVAAAPGLALGPPWRYEAATDDGAPRIGLDEAAARAARELERLAVGLRAEGGEREAEILEAQALMARDPALLDDARRGAASGSSAAEAVVAAGERLAAGLAELADERLAARAADVRDVARRIARIMLGVEAPRLTRRSIAVAADLPASVAAELQRDLLAGIALEGGSRTAHAAILARALGIPTVVGVDRLLDRVASADLLAVDGDRGVVIIDPDPAERGAIAEARPGGAPRGGQDGRPLETRDGHRVTLAANIGRPDEATPALAAGAEGIGLFRTEFMFMGRRTAPAEEEQSAAYAAVLSAFADRPVVFRLVDLGADKAIPYLTAAREANPFLGVRGIRLARRDPGLILAQLRALLRAGEATASTPCVMAPMVADATDLALFGELIDRAVADVPGAPRPRRGIMVEIPSAVTLAGELARRVDLLSIGTNDLTQYLLAADRTNPALAARQDALHPAVLQAIAGVVAAGRDAGTRVAVCGELAADPAGAVVLVGLGVEELSMEPAAFGIVKRALAGVDLAEARQLAQAALQAGDAPSARRVAEELVGARSDG